MRGKILSHEVFQFNIHVSEEELGPWNAFENGDSSWKTKIFNESNTFY